MGTSPLWMFLVLHLTGPFMGGKNQVSSAVYLDMAPNSFDDQYQGCGYAMEQSLQDPTQSDFASSRRYAAIWKLSDSTWDNKKGSLNLPSGFRENYGIAITAYTDTGDLSGDFNSAVRVGGQSSDYYNNSFQFKSFHFLLTKALQDLKAQKASCYDVYRGIKDIRFTIPDRQSPVRFGQFASSSLDRKVAERFGTDTFFIIRTCLGVNIMGFSFHPNQKEVLIPPYETFTVEDIIEYGGKTNITLKAKGKHSNFNCGSKSGAAPSTLSSGLPGPFLLWGCLFFSEALRPSVSL